MSNFDFDDFRARAATRLFSDDGALPVAGDHVLNPDFAPLVNKLTPAAVLIGIQGEGAGAEVVLTQRSLNLNKHSGQIAFPGGKVDQGDSSPAVTAMREACEEIGLHKSEVSILGYADRYMTGSGFDVVPVVAQIQRQQTYRPNPGEVEAVFSVPLAHLMDPQKFVRSSRMLGEKERYFYTIDYESWHIWGVTAGIIRTLYQRLYAG